MRPKNRLQVAVVKADWFATTATVLARSISNERTGPTVHEEVVIMCKRSNTPVLGFLKVFVPGLISSLGHGAAAQTKTEYPAPGVYAGSVQSTNGVMTTTMRAKMSIVMSGKFTIETGGLFPHMYECEFVPLKQLQEFLEEDQAKGINPALSIPKGPGVGFIGSEVLSGKGGTPVKGTIVRTPTGVRISFQIEGFDMSATGEPSIDDKYGVQEEVHGDLQRR